MTSFVSSRYLIFLPPKHLAYILSQSYILVWLYTFIRLPEDFARVAPPQMMSDCHMLRMNVCDAGRHAGPKRHEKGFTFIRLRAWLAIDRAKRTRQTVCDPDRRRHEKGLTFIRVEDSWGVKDVTYHEITLQCIFADFGV